MLLYSICSQAKELRVALATTNQVREPTMNVKRIYEELEHQDYVTKISLTISDDELTCLTDDTRRVKMSVIKMLLRDKMPSDMCECRVFNSAFPHTYKKDNTYYTYAKKRHNKRESREIERLAHELNSDFYENSEEMIAYNERQLSRGDEE